MKQPISTLKQITLSKWVEYQNVYGQELDNRFAQIMSLPKGKEREDLYLLYNVDYHQQNYAFYTGTPLETVKSLKVYDVCEMQGAAFIALKKEELSLTVYSIFDWIPDTPELINDSKWQIQPIFPKTKQLTKQQYDLVTDVALVFSDLQDGRHEALYELCAIYLRHVNEPYSSDLLEQRKELMKSLTLDIALCVKIYVEKGIKQLLNR